ncbi:succinyl-diaminopimelate desuccinylase [Clostridiales Family XIII bacterium PM5-7]
MCRSMKDSIIDDLRGLIAIKSISGKAEGQYPFGKPAFEAMQYCLSLCEKFGFRTKNCDNYLGYAEVGEGEPLIGILVHVDVVPPGNGWITDPYIAEVKDEKIYGRGVIDDKGPAITVIHALKEIVDSGKKLDKRVRIIFGCSEENGNWLDMEHYKKMEEIPDYGFTPDADFPVIYAEKGIAMVELKMLKEKSGIVSINGGDAPNMVAGHCSVTFLDDNGKEHTIEKTGKSAHGSMPELGENAIGLAMEECKSPFGAFYREIIGNTTDGSRLDCNLKDEQSGEITINPGMIKTDGQWVKLTLDIRFPISYSVTDVVERVKQKVLPYGVLTELIGNEKPVYMNKDSAFIKKLMAAYHAVTGDDTVPLTMGGGTYAKAMENIVAFGPVFPGRECTEHQPNEYIYVEDLYKAKKIYKKAILSI